MSRAADVPEDLPPPFVPATPAAPSTPSAAEDDEALEATGLMEPVAPAAEPEFDPRELKALSRQERKEAKAALRREQQEARNAARQAKAMAKAAAKKGRVAPAATPTDATGQTADEDADGIAESVVEDDETTTSDAPEARADGDAPETDESPGSGSSAPTDPRARAAQRVQRRLGKDAEKLSAAEARARAREEARRRRAQAKEQRSGVVAEEVVRPPEGAAEGNLDEDVSVVESLTEQTIEAAPLDADVAPEPADEPLGDEPIAEESAVEESAVEEPADDELAAEATAEATEAELPRPVIGQRIDDEPAPVDADVDVEAEEPPVVDEPEPVAAWKPAETREIRAYTPASPEDGEEEPKSRAQVGPIAGIVGLVALGISVLLAVGALLVALGFDSGGLYEVLRTVANTLVGPLDSAFDFSGANAERKEHFLAWGAGSIGYLLISFVGQAVQRSNDEG